LHNNKKLCRPVPQYFYVWVTKVIHWLSATLNEAQLLC